MTDIPGKIKEYIRLKKLFCDYLFKTRELSKTLYSIEELDSLIDYLDIYLDMGMHLQDNSNVLLKELNKERETVYDLLNKYTYNFYNMLDIKKSDPLMHKYRDNLTKYLDIKLIINNRRSDDLVQLETASELFHSHYYLFKKDNLNALLEKAITTLKKSHGNLLKQLPDNWYFLTSFHDRFILEKVGIFRIKQEGRHHLFRNMTKKSDEKPPEKVPVNKAGFLKKLKDHLIPTEDNINNLKTVHNIYKTEELDEFLIVRDLHVNLLRKYGRSIPLRMNHLIIKFYNEPCFWDEEHIFLNDLDNLRLGFAYYQYSMELEKGSEYAGLIFRKAVRTFKKCRVVIPGELLEKLTGQSLQ